MSMKLVHHSPLGPLEIPTVLGPVAPGEPFTVAADIGRSLLEQADLFTLAPKPAGSKPAGKTETAPKESK